MDERFRAVATLAEALTVLEQAIAAKYTKPADGIPSTDMDASVQSALALALTSVQSLANYYTKPEVDSIAAAIAATINATSGEVVASLPTASASTLGKIYYVGPTSGEYDRYVTSYDGTTYSWLQIGTTDVDMTQYATKAELSQLDQEVNGGNSETEQSPTYKPCRYVLVNGAMSALDSGSTYAYCDPVEIPADVVEIRVRGILNAAAFGGVFFSNNAVISASSAQATSRVVRAYYNTTTTAGEANDEMTINNATLNEIRALGGKYIYVGVYQSKAKEMVFITHADGLKDKVDALDNKVLRTRVDILTTDSETDIFYKLRNARDAGNCDIFWERGTYEFTETLYNLLRTIGEFSSRGVYELPLGGNCNYYFNNSVIRASLSTFDGSCNVFGCVRQNKGNWRLYDGTIIAEKVCYCVHDEAQGELGSYVHEYHNMVLSYVGTGSDLAKPIGGGTGQYGEIVIDNCVFLNTNDLSNLDASWHGRAHDGETGQIKIFARNNYFSKGLDIGSLDTEEIGMLVFCGNTSKVSPTNPKPAWAIYAFNNSLHD